MLLSVARHRFSEDICVIFQLEKSYLIPLLPPLFLHVFLYSFYTKANLRLDDPGPPVVKPLPKEKKKRKKRMHKGFGSVVWPPSRILVESLPSFSVPTYTRENQGPGCE